MDRTFHVSVRLAWCVCVIVMKICSAYRVEVMVNFLDMFLQCMSLGDGGYNDVALPVSNVCNASDE